MTTVIESRIARLARARGISFYEAASLLARRGKGRRRAAPLQAQRDLTRLRSTWAWRRDFE